MTPEKKIELEQKLKDSFQSIQSKSERYGYQSRLIIDTSSLQELLEEIIDTITVNIIQTITKDIKDRGQMWDAIVEVVEVHTKT